MALRVQCPHGPIICENWDVRKCVRTCDNGPFCSPCKKEVEVCLLKEDKLKVIYDIDIEKNKNTIIYSVILVIVVGDCPLIIQNITGKLDDGSFVELDDTFILGRNESKYVPLAIVTTSDDINSISVRVETDKGILETGMRFKNCDNSCEDLILVDKCLNFEQRVKECDHVCIPVTYTCRCDDMPICNIAKLIAKKGDCKRKLAVSNKTLINIKCVEPKIRFNTKICCEKTPIYCICKSNDTITATLVQKKRQCILCWKIRVKLDCISYKKRFKYFILVGDKIVFTGKFKLGDCKGLEFCSSGCTTIDSNCDNREITITPKVEMRVCWEETIYNLSNCETERGCDKHCITEESVPVIQCCTGEAFAKIVDNGCVTIIPLTQPIVELPNKGDIVVVWTEDCDGSIVAKDVIIFGCNDLLSYLY